MIHHVTNSEGWAMVQLSPSDDDVVYTKAQALNLLDGIEEEIR